MRPVYMGRTVAVWANASLETGQLSAEGPVCVATNAARDPAFIPRDELADVVRALWSRLTPEERATIVALEVKP